MEHYICETDLVHIEMRIILLTCPTVNVLLCLLLDGLHFGASKSIHKRLAIVSIAVAWYCHSLNIAQFLHIKQRFAHLGD